jgi:hypothetical protein
MKITLDGDQRNYAILKDKWTRLDWNRFNEAIEADAKRAKTNGEYKPVGADDGAVAKLYREWVSEICLVDVDGNEYRGLDAVLGVDFNEAPLELAVENFLGSIIWLAFEEARSLKKKISIS